MRLVKLAVLPAALSRLALAETTPAQACLRGCQAPILRDCAWNGPCGTRRLETSSHADGWQPRATQAFTRTVTRFDVEGLRLLQRMP